MHAAHASPPIHYQLAQRPDWSVLLALYSLHASLVCTDPYARLHMLHCCPLRSAHHSNCVAMRVSALHRCALLNSRRNTCCTDTLGIRCAEMESLTCRAARRRYRLKARYSYVRAPSPYKPSRVHISAAGRRSRRMARGGMHRLASRPPARARPREAGSGGASAHRPGL